MDIIFLKHLRDKGRSSLTWKTILYILLFSSLFTFLATMVQLFQYYQEDVGLIESRMELIEKSYLNPLSTSLWEVDKEQITTQLKGVLSLSDIQFVSLQEQTKELSFSMGKKSTENIISRQFPLKYSKSESESILLGNLLVIATLDNARQRILNKLLLILVTQAVKTLCVSFCIFCIIYFLLTRHLITIAEHVSSSKLDIQNNPLKLNRKPPETAQLDMVNLSQDSQLADPAAGGDELDQLVTAINKMNFFLYQKIEALRVREEQYRAVAENIGDHIMRYDKKFRHIYANKNAFEFAGLPEDQYIGKTHREMGFSEQLFELWEENIQYVFDTGTQKNIEFDVESADGLITFELQLNPEFSADGNVETVIGISRDITHRKLTEEKLHRSIADLNESVKAGRVGLWNWDLATNEVNYSAEWKRQIGYKEHEIGSDFSEWEDRVHPDDFKPTIKIIEKSIKDVNQDHRTEFQFRHKDGSYRWILAQASFIQNKKGHPIRMVGSHLDITDQKQKEVEKKKLESRLQQAQKMESIGNLAGGIAHDFNNLLFPIIGMSEMLLEDLPSSSLEYENAQEIYDAGIRAGDLVQQILAFSRKSEHKMTPVRVQNVLKEVLKLIRSTIPTDIEIRQDIRG